ncbi:glycosyltransferase [Actinophytocola glycyrrhizae]|uniref:Glycosyltransferase n=1 Tax=Actinophytocola glycyrrhizae TaxID=2044873 RepID=A0ABV9SD70_9PSEU
MRVALITDGAEVGRDTADLAAALTRLGHEPVVHADTDGTWRHRGHAAAWFTERWRAGTPDVVHCRSRVAGDAAVTAARLLGIPVVYSVRTADAASVGPAERAVAQRADRVIASCATERAELFAGRVQGNRISVVPFGVDVEHFTPDGDRSPAGRRRRLLAVGELTTGSGFATAVAALAGLPDTELLIAGTSARGAHAKDLQAYARHLGVSDRLEILGHVDAATVPGLIRSAVVVLVTPWRPRFGVAAVEAAACGTAVVAANTGGLTDTVIDQVTGLLVAPRRPRSLAAAVWKLLASPVLLEQYGAAARDRARARYSWHHVALETVTAYQQAGAVGDRVLVTSDR